MTYNPVVNLLLIYSLAISCGLSPIYYGSGNCKMRHCGNNRHSTHARYIQRIGNKMIRHYKH
jgi:hypothetical protein